MWSFRTPLWLFRTGIPCENTSWTRPLVLSVRVFPLKWSGIARVAELVDALDLGSSVLRRRGSSPLSRTTTQAEEMPSLLEHFRGQGSGAQYASVTSTAMKVKRNAEQDLSIADGLVKRRAALRSKVARTGVRPFWLHTAQAP